MIYVRLPHEDRPNLRAFIVAEAGATSSIKHFYLELLQPDKSWKRLRKISGGRFEQWMDRLKFDKVEAAFLLEEAAAKEEGY